MSKQVSKCPEECVFDWKDFHSKLDIAFAHYIEELDGGTESTIMSFLKYSYEKKNLQDDNA